MTGTTEARSPSQSDDKSGWSSGHPDGTGSLCGHERAACSCRRSTSHVAACRDPGPATVSSALHGLVRHDPRTAEESAYLEHAVRRARGGGSSLGAVTGPVQSIRVDVDAPLVIARIVALVICAVVVSVLTDPARAPAATCADHPNEAAAQRAQDTRDADGDGVYCECEGSGLGGGGPDARARRER
jgi:hypothetical protein